MKKIIGLITLASILLAPLHATASGVEKLKAYFESTNAMRADFHQTVLDAQGKKMQEVNGVMQLKRPGKFRWDYFKPYVQEIVGDGTRVWLYDPELNQVTVRMLSKALGSSPAALLAGNKEIEKGFDLKDDGERDGLDWVIAMPKDKDSGFEKIDLGFAKDSLQKMQLHDSFGHTTVIEFSKLERNPKFADQVFNFKPPAGADIVGE